MVGVPVNSTASASFSAERPSMCWKGQCSWQDHPPVEVCKQGLIICSLWQAGAKKENSSLEVISWLIRKKNITTSLNSR